MGENEEDGGALPPAARAYDFRTGRPLDDPVASASPPWRPEDDADDLGIWAPRDEPYQAAPQPSPAVQPPGAYQPAPYQQPGTHPQPGGYQQPATYQHPGASPPPPAYQQPAAYQHPVTHQQAGEYPATTAEHAPLPPSRSNRTPVVVLLLGAVLAVAALVAVLLLTRDRSSPPRTPAATSNPVASAGTSTGPPEPTASPSGGSDTSARAAFARDVDGILSASAEGRRQVIAAINGVRNNCDVSPSEAVSSLDGVIANRRAVLTQVNALSTPDAATATAKADLVQALTASLEANQAYQRWLDNALTTYPDASPTGCPSGGVPSDSDYDAATAASGRATSAKQQFVGVYNPIATQAGLTTWTADQF